MFGVGVSAESVIDGIKEEWEAEGRRSDQRARKARFLASTAFLGERSVKAAFLADLEVAAGRGDPVAEGRDLATILQLPHADFSWLAAHLRVPELLSATINAIFAGLRQATLFASPSVKEDEAAVTWLLEVFNAIEPGVDLRFIVDQFQAALVAIGLTFMRNGFCISEREKTVARAAFDILCARARGIVVPEDTVVKARQAIASVADKEGMDFPYNVMNAGRATLNAIAFALDRQPELVAMVGARNNMSNSISGDVVDVDFWQTYSWELLDLIKKAPTTRLKIIDLNVTIEKLGLD
jgi:hypothetical protein